MAQKHKGHSHLTGKYVRIEAGRELSKHTKYGKTIASKTGDSLHGYQQAAASFNNLATEAPGSQLAAYVTAASEVVKRAREQVQQAQKQLREAQDVEKAMVELTQLQEVRQAHQALYGPDKETGLTVAQQYLAFKKTLREQPE